MARRLNWEKNRQEKVLADSIRGSWQDQKYDNIVESEFVKLLEKDIWPIKGKYKGTQIKALPTHYLQWIIKNFKIGVIQNVCREEIIRRTGVPETKTKADKEKILKARAKIKALRKAN